MQQIKKVYSFFGDGYIMLITFSGIHQSNIKLWICKLVWLVDKYIIKLTPGALTNAEKHVTSNIVYSRIQRNTKDAGFGMAKMTLFVLTLTYFSHCVSLNVIFDGATNELSIR